MKYPIPDPSFLDVAVHMPTRSSSVNNPPPDRPGRGLLFSVIKLSLEALHTVESFHKSNVRILTS